MSDAGRSCLGWRRLDSWSAMPRKAPAAAASALPDDILDNWYKLILELVRHTPTYSPPVASRAFAYIGVTAYEAVAGGIARPSTRSPAS